MLVRVRCRPDREAAHADSLPDRYYGASVSPAHLLVALESLGAQISGDPATFGLQSRGRAKLETEVLFLPSHDLIVKIMEKGIDLLKPQEVPYLGRHLASISNTFGRTN